MLMTHLLSTFCPPSGTISELFTVTRKSVKACLSAQKYFRLSLCEGNDSCFSKALSSNSEVSACQELNDGPIAIKPERVQEAARRFLQGKICAMETRRMKMWQVAWRLSVVQAFPHHIAFTLSQYFDKIGLFSHRKILLFTLQSEGYMSQLTDFMW